MSDNNITMKDIARELGVSVATVSRALKNNPKISEMQREKIQTFAREHHFSPNVLAESLRKTRTAPLKIIGVIIPQITHYYFSSILSGIEEQATVRGYRIMVAQSDEKYEKERRICDSFIEHRLCGVIVSQAKDTVKYDHFHKLMESNMPLVFYDRICTGINTNRVVVDDYMGALTAVTHLIETGCKRIAFYGSPMQLEISKNRYNGYRDAILKHGLTLDDSLYMLCDNRSDAEAITPEVLSRSDRPDAFFAVNDDTAIGILYTAKRMGLRVPEDVSICGFTNGERAIACDPMLTTVEQRGHMVGEEAVDILVNHVEGLIPMDKVEKKVVRTRLVVRGTTR
ncbi:MAG: LacI family DNA-binding transcriptional regulator [Prevotella sp.]|nr:LacI family transcriptional regulator [Prevotella sp.]MDY6131272.1 LacI family DNA-binding transcriptional regulator [Prevotella sp.]